MDNDIPMRDDTPPKKRRRTSQSAELSPNHHDQPPRPRVPAPNSPNHRREARSDTADRARRTLSRSPRRSYRRQDDANRAQSRSPSRRRHRTRSHSHSRSRTRRRTQSRSRSRPRFTDRSRRFSSRSEESRSTTDRTRSESFSPERARLTPPRELVKPNYQAQMVLKGHSKSVSQVRISPDGRFLASASADGSVKIWDAATGSNMDTLVGHMAGVSCLAWSPDSNTLATGSDDKAIRMWDRMTGRPKTTTRKLVAGQDMPPLRGHHNYIHCLAFSPKGNILASGSYDEAVFLWDVRAGRLMRSLPAHSDPVSGIDFCSDGTLVVSCSTDGLIRVWDTSTGQCLRTLVHEDNPAVTNVCFSPNGRFVLAFSLDNCIRLWDYVSGSVKKTYQGHKNEKFAVGGCFAVLNGEPLVASASEDGRIVIWDVRTKDVLQRVTSHEGPCFWVDILGSLMASAGKDGTVRVYRHADEPAAPNGNGIQQEVTDPSSLALPIRQDDGPSA